RSVHELRQPVGKCSHGDLCRLQLHATVWTWCHSHGCRGAVGNHDTIIIDANVKTTAHDRLFLVDLFLNLQSTLSNDQRVNGLLTVLAMYRQFEPLHQEILHHLGSTIRRLTFRNLGQNIPSGFVHPTRSRQLIPFYVVSVWDQVGKRHESVFGTGSVDVHPDM